MKEHLEVSNVFIDGLKKQITEILQKYIIFEANDTKSQRWFRSALNVYLSDKSYKELIRDYIVVCDDTNNTPDIVNRNAFVASVYHRHNASDKFHRLDILLERESVIFDEVQ